MNCLNYAGDLEIALGQPPMCEPNHANIFSGWLLK